MGEAGFSADLQEALDPTTHSEGERLERVWSAYGRVADDDATGSWHDGDSNGATVTVRIITGDFVGAELACQVMIPMGGSFGPIQPGMIVKVSFIDGTIDGPRCIDGIIPGGKANPLGTAAAGVDMTADDALQKHQVNRPPKGVGIINYIRGAPYAIRLKGTTPAPTDGSGPGYAGEFYLEADDAANSPDGNNGTFLRLVQDPSTKSFGLKLRTAEGAYLQILQDALMLMSADGNNYISVSNAGVIVNGVNLTLGGSKFISANGGLILLNVPPGLPPLPPFAALHGVGGPATVPSTSVFIGM